MSLVTYGTINAEDPFQYSKFTVKGGNWVNPDDHDEGVVPTTFNVNSDIIVPKFWSGQKCLTVLYDGGDIAGYQTFRGSIGNGTIFMKTSKGMTIKGPISGGPAQTQTFTGAGTWTQG